MPVPRAARWCGVGGDRPAHPGRGAPEAGVGWGAAQPRDSLLARGAAVAVRGQGGAVGYRTQVLTWW